jgi:hypothetical protein
MRYRNRKQATQYLREEKGLACGHAYLAQLAVNGTGPLFRYNGRYPVYTEQDLDAWIEARLSSPVRSTAEAAAAKHEPLGPPTRKARPRAKPKTSELDLQARGGA